MTGDNTMDGQRRCNQRRRAGLAGHMLLYAPKKRKQSPDAGFLIVVDMDWNDDLLTGYQVSELESRIGPLLRIRLPTQPRQR